MQVHGGDWVGRCLDFGAISFPRHWFGTLTSSSYDFLTNLCQPQHQLHTPPPTAILAGKEEAAARIQRKKALMEWNAAKSILKIYVSAADGLPACDLIKKENGFKCSECFGLMCYIWSFQGGCTIMWVRWKPNNGVVAVTLVFSSMNQLQEILILLHSSFMLPLHLHAIHFHQSLVHASEQSTRTRLYQVRC